FLTSAAIWIHMEMPLSPETFLKVSTRARGSTKKHASVSADLSQAAYPRRNVRRRGFHRRLSLIALISLFPLSSTKFTRRSFHCEAANSNYPHSVRMIG